METVLFTQRVEIIESYRERRDCADQRVSDFLSVCGYLPVPVPNHPKIACAMAEELKPKALVLSGGNNLSKYQGDAPERDMTERELIRLALERELPLYGFCRGMQMILDFFGASLEKTEGHTAVMHEIQGVCGIRTVNSYHTLSCIDTADTPVEPLAKTADGVIEAAQVSGKKILCTMWHPERMEPYEQKDIKMVRAFFEEGKIIL